jgi:hypothetical protein
MVREIKCAGLNGCNDMFINNIVPIIDNTNPIKCVKPFIGSLK